MNWQYAAPKQHKWLNEQYVIININKHPMGGLWGSAGMKIPTHAHYISAGNSDV